MSNNDVFVQIDQGSGEVQFYQDPYKNVDAAAVEKADEITRRIREEMGTIEQSFLKVGFYLDLFEQNRYYLARGCGSFREWCDSPELDISYRKAMDLIRLVREAYPILPGTTPEEKLGVLTDAGVSKSRELLPLLSAGKEDAFIAMIEEAPHLTWRDLRKEVKTMLGQDADPTDANAFFKVHAQRQGEVAKVTVTCHDSQGAFPCGVLTVPLGAAPRFLNRFNAWEGDLS